MEQSEYTLPGVMNFLRTEWQRREQTRIEWEIERADMRSRISKLEAEKLELQRERDKTRRHLEILYGQRLSKSNGMSKMPDTKIANSATSPGPADSNGDTHHSAEKLSGNETEANGEHSEPQANGNAKEHEQKPITENESVSGNRSDVNDTEMEESQDVSDGLMKTVSESQEYLRQCVADIRHILRQTSTVRNEAESIVAPQPGLGSSQNFITLANFGSAALTVAALPNSRVAAGTVNGDLLIWEGGSTEPRKFGENAYPVNCMRFSTSGNRIVAGIGTTLQIFNNDSVPQLIASHDFGDYPILRLAVAPSGNLIAIVQANGAASVWSIQGGSDLIKMSDPAAGVRVCDFAEVNGDLHLVLARNSDPSDPESTEGSLLLADPLTGQLLKKIVFSFSAGISSILLTSDAIVLGTDGGDLRVLGLTRGETLAEVTAAHRGEITSLNIVHGQSLLSTSIDGRVSIWSIPSLLWSGRMFSHDSGYGALCSSATEDTVVVGGGDGIIRVYKESKS